MSTWRKAQQFLFTEKELSIWLPNRSGEKQDYLMTALQEHGFLALDPGTEGEVLRYHLTAKGLRTLGFDPKTLKTDCAGMELSGFSPIDITALKTLKTLAQEQQADASIQAKKQAAIASGELKPSANPQALYVLDDGPIRNALYRDPVIASSPLNETKIALNNLWRTGLIAPVKRQNLPPTVLSPEFALGIYLEGTPKPSFSYGFVRSAIQRDVQTLAATPPSQYFMGWEITDKGLAALQTLEQPR